MMTRIRDEGLHHSQVMDTLFQLTDVIGPRLTGSPQAKQANEWTRDQFTRWGLVNAHLEGYPFGRGWSFSACQVRMVAPRTAVLLALPKAWAPGTNGPVRGAVMRVKIESEKDLDRTAARSPARSCCSTTPGEFKQPDERARRSGAPRRRTCENGRAPVRGSPNRATAGTSRRAGAASSAPSCGRRSGVPGAGEGRSPPSRRAGGPTASCGSAAAAPGSPGRAVGVPGAGDGRRALQRDRRAWSRTASRWSSRSTSPPASTTTTRWPTTRSPRSPAPTRRTRSSCSAATSTPGTAAPAPPTTRPASRWRWRRCASSRRSTSSRGARSASRSGPARSRACSAPTPTSAALRDPSREHGPEQTDLPESFREDTWPLQLKPEHAKLSAYFNLDNGTGKIRGIYLQGNDAVRPIFAPGSPPSATSGPPP